MPESLLHATGQRHAAGQQGMPLGPADGWQPRRNGLRAAVVGSGFGGLAAAIRLQAMGFETVCFEARDKPGGRAYVYEDAGFTFDAGPTVITAPHCLEELYELAERKLSDYVELLPVEPFYRLRWSDGVEFDYVGDETRLIEQIRKIEPRDVKGYRRFAEYARDVFREGYLKLGAEPFLRFTDMVKVAPQLMRLRADRSVYRTVSRYLSDEHLRQAFSFHSLLVGGNPYETSSIYTLIHWIEREWGVFFPRGGTGALVQGLVKLFRELGGDLRLQSPVDHISLVERDASKNMPAAAMETVGSEANGQTSANSSDASPRNVRDDLSSAFPYRHVVSLTDQPDEAFDVVVSNADVHHTYRQLYGRLPRGERVGRRLERMKWSMSLFVMYFGTNRRFPDVAHHTILFGPRFRGLLRDIFHGTELPEDFSLYLHAPTVTDPSLAPPGCEAFYVLSPVPHLGQAAIDWETVGKAYGDAILQQLEEYLPGLQESIVTRRDFTPRDFQRELSAYHGSAFSVAPQLTQSAFFRPHNRDAQIPGLYIVGAGTHPGAGVPGVINTAKATSELIRSDLGVTV